MRNASVFLLLILVCIGCSDPSTIRMATTTSTENSGLLDILIPKFREKHNIDVHVIAVGTGKALKLGQNGDVDIVFVHSRNAEDKFVSDRFGLNRKDVMYNDFVIIGPKDNPAKVDESEPVSSALKKIADAKITFISRADESGTHKKEKSLWQKAKITPYDSWYLETGQGMGATIKIADEKRGYCLVDRGTYIAYRNKTNLVILNQGDKNLFNPYGIIAVNPEKHPSVKYNEAITFIEWITSPEGQKIIGDYKKNGEVLFYPNAK